MIASTSKMSKAATIPPVRADWRQLVVGAPCDGGQPLDGQKLRQQPAAIDPLLILEGCVTRVERQHLGRPRIEAVTGCATRTAKFGSAAACARWESPMRD